MDKQRIKDFAGHVFRDMSGAMVAGLGYIGTTTGLFRAMADKGPMSAEEVIERSGLEARYVEEWLRGMVCAGYLDFDPDAETYRLPDEHAFLLASDGTDHFMGGLFSMAPVLLGVAPRVAAAFKDGGGVPFEDFGAEGVRALDAVNYGQYEARFAGYWLKSLPDVAARLENGGRVLDVGCGVGRVCLALAKAFPKTDIVGLDPDRESIRQAEALAAETDLRERVRFVAASTGDLDGRRKFDLITACDCIHDFVDPARTLSEIRRLLTPDGVLFVVEPKVADRLEDNINPIAAMYYGFSVFHCMTQSLADGGPGLGTCMGAAKAESLMRDAGFTRFHVVDIKSQVNMFYEVRP